MKLHKNVLLTFLILFTSCNKESPPPQQKSTLPKQFTISIPVFDGKSAYAYLKKQTELGPRNPGSPGHQLCKEYLYNELRKYADTVYYQRFNHRGYDGKNISMANIIASFGTKTSSRILLGAHWDTRPRADRDPEPNRRDLPILGANDGASGVAILLEIARLLKDNPPNVGVDIIFFDGEDYGKEGDLSQYLLGSKYFAKNIPFTTLPDFGIVLDLVGDKNLEISREESSMRYAPDVVEMVWNTANQLSIPNFKEETRHSIIDDHLPLNEIGSSLLISTIQMNHTDTGTHTKTHQINVAPKVLKRLGVLLPTSFITIVLLNESLSRSSTIDKRESTRIYLSIIKRDWMHWFHRRG